MPISSTEYGILSTIPIKDLFIDEFLADKGFEVLLTSSGGVNSNKAAIRILIAELTRYKQRLAFRPDAYF